MDPSGIQGSEAPRILPRIILLLTSLILLEFPGGSGSGALASSDRGFAVVELFTSEGCSSCPPADALLGRLAEESRSGGRSIYLLAYHVDYWDRLGWKDRFSDPAFTARQEEYAQALGGTGAYTPQMIVNGRDEFVGSAESRARRSISSALARPAAAQVTLTPGEIRGRTLPLGYSVAGTRTPELLRLALVERGLSTQVAGGENAGRRLTHENVVRHLETVSLSGAGSGRAEIQIPDSVALAHASLIAFVQDPKSGAILGATAVDLGPPHR